MLRTAGKMALKRGLEYSMSKTFRSDKNRLHLSEKGEELKDPLGGKVIRVTFGGVLCSKLRNIWLHYCIQNKKPWQVFSQINYTGKYFMKNSHTKISIREKEIRGEKNSTGTISKPCTKCDQSRN